MFGNRYSINNHNPVVYCKDAVDAVEDLGSSAYDAVEDAVSDVGDFIGDAATDVYQQVVYPVYSVVETAAQQAAAEAERAAEAAIAEAQRLEARTAAEFSRFEDRVEKELDRWVDDVSKIGQHASDAMWDMVFYYPTEWAIKLVDFGFESIGLHSPTKFFKGLNTGLRHIQRGAIRGQKDEMIMAGVVIIAVVTTILSAGAAGSAWGSVLGSFTALSSGTLTAGQIVYVLGYLTWNVLQILSFIYGVYSLVMLGIDIAAMGNLLRRGGISSLSSITKVLEKAKIRMGYTFVSNMFNGQMSMWMAGGDLYDSMKAGDISFKTNGNLNSQVFLGLPNTNGSTPFDTYASGSIGNFQATKKNALAGDMFFSGTRLVA